MSRPMNTEQRARELLSEVLPYLREAAEPFEDDGGNEPLELARRIEAHLDVLSQPVGAGEGFVCVGWEFNDPRDEMGWQRLHGVSPESLPPYEPPVEMRRIYVATPTPPAAAQEDGRDAAYLRWRLEEIMPLFQEARDALCGITEIQMRLRGISPTLADRMDAAGTRTREQFDAAMLTSPDSGKEGDRG